MVDDAGRNHDEASPLHGRLPPVVETRRMFEQCPFSVQIFSADGWTQWANAAWERMWRVKHADLVGRFNVLQDEQLRLAGLLPLIERAFAGEAVTVPVVRFETAQSIPDVAMVPYRYAQAFLYPVRNPDGTIHEIVLMHEDVTERVEAEHELRESEARLRRFVESNIIGIGFWTVDGAFTEGNDAFLDIVGYTREELETGLVRWPDLTPPEYTQADARALAQLRSSGTCAPYEKEFLRGDGRRVPVLLAAATLDEQRTTGIAYVLDITDRRRAEQREREVALEERQKLARDLHDSVTQSVFSLGLLTRTAMVQHQRQLDTLGVTLDRIVTVSQQALTEMRAMLYELQPTALVAEGLGPAMVRLVEARRVRHDGVIEANVEAAPRLPDDQESAMFRIVQEALTNASKYAGASRIEVALRVSGRWVEALVQDNGAGFESGGAGTAIK